MVDAVEEDRDCISIGSLHQMNKRSVAKKNSLGTTEPSATDKGRATMQDAMVVKDCGKVGRSYQNPNGEDDQNTA